MSSEGSALKKLIQDKGLSVAEFSDKSGFSRAAVYNWLKSDLLTPDARKATIHAIGVDPVLHEDGGESPGDGVSYVSIPKVAVEVEAGSGFTVTDEAIVGDRKFRRAYIEEQGASVTDSRSVKVHGRSMEPFLYEGDTITVDTSRREPTGNKALFVIRWHDAVSVKWLRKHSGGIDIISENKEYETETINLDEPGDFEVIGYVWDMNRRLPRP